jgi:prevent-host-death family protein
METTILPTNEAEYTEVLSLMVEDAKPRLGSLLEQVETEDLRGILTQDGEAKGVIISMEAFAFLERMIEAREDEIDIAQAERILAESQPEDWISLDQFKLERNIV